MLVIFSGGSGVGKNTVINSLMQDDRYDLMPTYTTRGQRENETAGKPYYFISKEEFEAKIEEGKELYEYNLVHGNYYGASRVLYNEKAKSGKILLKDIDVEGTQNLLNTLGREVPMLTFFFRVDSREVLEKRLRERKETEAEIEKRLARYDLEQTFQTRYDYIITNNNLEETVGFCNDIINHTVAGRKLISTKPMEKLDMDKVEEIAGTIKADYDSVEPVIVTVKDHELYIVDGHHRYLAALSCGKKIAAYVVIENEINADVDQKEWFSLLEKIQK